MSVPLQLHLSQADLERMARLAQQRGLDDLTTYVRELVDADAARQRPEREQVTAQLRSAELLGSDWRALDEEIAALEARGIQPADHPLPLPANSLPSEALIDQDRGEY